MHSEQFNIKNNPYAKITNLVFRDLYVNANNSITFAYLILVRMEFVIPGYDKIIKTKITDLNT